MTGTVSERFGAMKSDKILFPVFSVLLLIGCATSETKTIRRNLTEAETAINSAKLIGNSSDIAQAEYLYKKAALEFQKKSALEKPLFSSRPEQKNESAENAQLAKKVAEDAILKAKRHSDQLALENRMLSDRLDDLKYTVRALRKQKHPQSPVIGPDTLYRNASRLFNEGDYEGSRGIFESFLEIYPNHALSDNAQYWIGECHYSRKQFKKAAEAFEAVWNNYRGWNKSAGALLKIGICHLRLHDKQKARRYFQLVVKRFPKSDSATLAKKYLDSFSGFP